MTKGVVISPLIKEATEKLSMNPIKTYGMFTQTYRLYSADLIIINLAGSARRLNFGPSSLHTSVLQSSLNSALLYRLCRS